MATLSANGYISNAARTQGEVKADLETTKDFLREKFGSQSLSTTAFTAASTVDLTTCTGEDFTVTGATAITSFGSLPANVRKRGRCLSSGTITHNGTSLICPGGANISFQANDTFEVMGLGSGNVIISDFQRASGVPVLGGMVLLATSSGTGSVATIDLTLPAGFKYFRLFIREIIPATNATDLYLRVSQNSGSTYPSTGYDYGANLVNAATGSASFYSGATITTAAILLAQSLPNSNGYNFAEVTIFPGNASRLPRVNYAAGWITSGSATISQNGSGQYGGSVGAATNLRLLMSSGNIALAYDLYGIA